MPDGRDTSLLAGFFQITPLAHRHHSGASGPRCLSLGERLEIRDHVGALARIFHPRKGHGGIRDDRLRAREPSVERRRVPGRPGVLEGVRVARESGDRAGAPVPDRREAGPGEVNAGLDRMTGRALLEEGSAASRFAARCVSRRVCRRPTHEYEHQKDRRKDDGENDGYGWRSSHFHESYFSDRKSTRLNSSHGYISYAVFCLKKKKKYNTYKFQPQHHDDHLVAE